jgi:hypothetical protein
MLPAFAPQERGDPAVAEPRTLAHQLAHSSDERRFVVAPLRLASLTRPRLTQDSAGPTLGHGKLVLQLARGLSLPSGAHQFPSATNFSI